MNKVIALISILALAGCAGIKSSSFSNEPFQSFNSGIQSLSRAERIAKISQYYQDHKAVCSEQLDPKKNISASDMFQAANMYHFYTSSLEAVKCMKHIYEHDFYGEAAPVNYLGELHAALLQSRLFSEASFLETNTASLTHSPYEVPSKPSVNQPSYWTISGNGSGIQKHLFNDGNYSLVIVARPSCNYSVRALNYIINDPELSKLSKRTLIITPQDRNLFTSELSEWNKNHPEWLYAIANQESDFSFINDWSTPNFYFLQNGKLVRQLTGWRDVSSGEQFREIVRSLAQKSQ